MLTLTDLRSRSEELIKRLEIRGIDASALVNKALDLDLKVRDAKSGMEALKSEANNIAKMVGDFMRNKEIDKAEEAKKSTTDLKIKVKEAEEALTDLEA